MLGYKTERDKQKRKEYYWNHRQEELDRNKKWRDENKDNQHKKYKYGELYYLTHKYKYTNLEDKRILSKKKNVKLKKIILSHYSNGSIKCNCCGINEIECLTIDHINGDGSKHRRENNIRSGSFYRWLINNNYPEGYQVLCMNCNFAKGTKPKCPLKHLY